MMSHEDRSADSHSNSQSTSNSTDGDVDFGRLLVQARKTKKLTIDEVSEHLKIPVHTIKALEANDLASLPAPTFAQGYIRAYAKLLEISEEKILEIYSRAVPHEVTSILKPRSKLPGETNSQSPLIKTITTVLLIAGVAVVGFGSFQYYQKKAGVMEDEWQTREQSFTGNSIDSPASNHLDIKQKARLSEEGKLIVGGFEYGSDEPERAAEETTAVISSAAQPDVAGSNTEPASITASRGEETGIRQSRVNEAGNDESSVSDTRAVTENDGETLATTSSRFADAIAHSATEAGSASGTRQRTAGVGNENDVLEVFAVNGAWIEVHDANESRLLYNMLPAGTSKVLVGQAPFSISMGNAKTTRVVINDLEIDMAAYIRSNNTAVIKVSTQGKNIIFH